MLKHIKLGYDYVDHVIISTCLWTKYKGTDVDVDVDARVIYKIKCKKINGHCMVKISEILVEDTSWKWRLEDDIKCLQVPRKTSWMDINQVIKKFGRTTKDRKKINKQDINRFIEFQEKKYGFELSAKNDMIGIILLYFDDF